MSSKLLVSTGWMIVIAALLSACAEANNPAGTTGGGGGSSGGSGGAVTTGGGGATSTGQAGDGTGGSSGGPGGIESVVFNEIGAVGSDFVELKNIGNASVDVSGYGVADSDDAGQPRLDQAMRFPDGAEIASGERLLIVAEQDPADGVGPHTDCLSGAADTCYWAQWGISASKGEKVFLVGPDDAVVIEQEYPQDAAADGNSWGRLPDGTGDFEETLATPGKKNAAP